MCAGLSCVGCALRCEGRAYQPLFPFCSDADVLPAHESRVPLRLRRNDPRTEVSLSGEFRENRQRTKTIIFELNS